MKKDNNGNIHVTSKIIDSVMTAASEAEYVAIYMNGKIAIPFRTALMELGHTQPSTPIQTDNQTAMGIANESINSKFSKPIAMRYNWVQDQVRDKTFNILWKPGQMNLADYPSKHHPAHHHVKVQGTYIHQANTLLRGCVNLQTDPSTTNAYKNILHTVQQCTAVQSAKYSLNNNVLANSTKR